MSTYDWTNEHDWGTAEQQQANIDAPDERKVTTITGWAILKNEDERAAALHRQRHDRQAKAIDLLPLYDKTRPWDAPHRVVRLDITISEDAPDDGDHVRG